ncbi:hypothetical protein KBK19_01610 [Microvirga sp. STR05]|uniref:Uncharacterized protein n=1 Tax=Hymenobacter duratus TaxID=2771356 RepID=A0ABR8JEC8_9BACT|nr:hypothetical protein [Hymenobacter duratus]MBD2713725.1 hypothetical protein [Hymenobacter duratus]MBR7948627.1 hypothetical protein [Microvirga sp. STR05]
MVARLALLVCSLVSVLTLQAQPAETPATYAVRRATLDQCGMLVLGSWATGNIGVSGARYFTTEGKEKYFHQMNVGWGVVNLALAGTFFLAARRPPAETSRPELVKAQLRTENLYLLNAGLDVAYVATGFYLKERAKSRSSATRHDQLRGYGESLLLQGGFLLAFDGLLYVAHHRHGQHQLLSAAEPAAGGPRLRGSGSANQINFYSLVLRKGSAPVRPSESR